MPGTPLLRASALLLALSCCIVNARPASAAWPGGTNQALVIAPAATDEFTSGMSTLADGAGGMFVAFTKDNTIDTDVFLERITGAGAVSPGWPAGGVAVCTLAGGQFSPQLVSDGAGGVYVIWLDRRSGTHQDVFAQRITASGAISGGWPAAGLALSGGVNDKNQFAVCSDAAGGAFIAWDYAFTPGTDNDLYLSHVLPGATNSSLALDVSIGLQQAPAIATDGAGGCYVGYESNVGGDFNIRVMRVNAAMTVVFPSALASNAGGDQQGAVLLPFDNSGGSGVMVAWTDKRFVSYTQVYFSVCSPAGSISGAIGRAVAGTSESQQQPQMVPDNAGGLFVTWVDYRVAAPGQYLQHFSFPGQAYPGWPALGLPVGSGTPWQLWGSALVSDGSNGAFVVWPSPATSIGSLYGSHVSALGVPAPLVAAGGNLLFYNNGGAAQYPALVGDGQGGALLQWQEIGSHLQLFAQHVDAFAVTGDARPLSEGVKDLPADQGGQVRFTWDASWLDNAQDRAIGTYWIWRQAPLTLAQAAVRGGATWADGVAPEAGRRAFRHAANASGYAWEFLASQPANHSARYSYVAATTTDSIAGHNPYTVFMVEAHAAADANAFWQSAPDSGYSADNLPPATPAPFTGQYAPSATALQWGANHEGDLAGYKLYRGASAGFVPGPGNLVIALATTSYSASAAPPSFWKLTAVDAHGNESAPALLQPTGTAGVDDVAPRTLAFTLATANPSRGDVALRLALPSEARVRVAIYDAAGRAVRTLADGAFAPGTHVLAWDGRDAAGARTPSGLYFARLVLPGEERVERIVRMR